MRMNSLLLRIGGTAAGQIAYLVALSYAWMSLGWKYNETHGHFLGNIAALVACIVNPLICAYIAKRATYDRQKMFTATVWVIFFVMVLACAPISNAIWLHVGGYYGYLMTPGFAGAGETLALNQLVSIVGSVVSGIVFIVSYGIIKKRGNRDR